MCKIDVFNYWIGQFIAESTEIVLHNKKIMDTAKTDMLLGDGVTLSDLRSSLFGNPIAQILIPDLKSRKDINQGAVNPNVKTTEFYEEDSSNIGHVIGKGGAVMKSIIEVTKTSVTFCRFVEKSKKRDGNGKSTDGCLITGTIDNIGKAKKRAKDAIINADEYERKNKLQKL